MLALAFGSIPRAGSMTGIFLVEFGIGWIIIAGTFRVDRAAFACWPWFGWASGTLAAVATADALPARGYLLKTPPKG